MKLEVGQKIGIYEPLDNGGFERLNIDHNYLGFKNEGLIELYGDFQSRINDLFFPMKNSEVRKVGSLIVKRIK